MYEYSLVNCFFFRIVSRRHGGAPSLYQMITQQLIELGSCLWHHWKAYVIFRLPNFGGAGHKHRDEYLIVTINSQIPPKIKKYFEVNVMSNERIQRNQNVHPFMVENYS